jgi:hypothetical protein
MPRGGRRQGAGRKPSSLSIKSQAVAQIAIDEGITPLEVMLRAMRTYANSAQWDRAAAIAKDAAPYLHSKLTSVEPTSKELSIQAPPDYSKLTDEELATLERLAMKIQT